MDKSAPSMLKATLIGGAVAGFAASIPFVDVLNCLCCSLVIAGGFLAAFLYSKDCARAGAEFRPGSGALVGLVAGLFYALASTAGGAVRRLISPQEAQEAVDQMLEQLEGKELPSEVVDSIARFVELFASWSGLFILFWLTLLIAAVFSTVGGLIGGAVFKTERRPTPDGLAPPPV